MMIIIMNDKVNDNDDKPLFQRKQNLQALHSALCEMSSISSEEREKRAATARQSETEQERDRDREQK